MNKNIISAESVQNASCTKDSRLNNESENKNQNQSENPNGAMLSRHGLPKDKPFTKDDLLTLLTEEESVLTARNDEARKEWEANGQQGNLELEMVITGMLKMNVIEESVEACCKKNKADQLWRTLLLVAAEAYNAGLRAA